MVDTLRINELFYSVQGESTRAGLPCFFIRLTGCHLRCRYCDTEYAFKEGRTRPIDELVEEACQHPTDLVQVTGGEPLLQKRAANLICRLIEAGKTVLVETSGACDIDCGGSIAAQADAGTVVRIVDIKTPGSGESERMDWENMDRLRPTDEVKFVIVDHADYEFAKGVINRYDLFDRVNAVLFSPVFEQPAGEEIEGIDGLPLGTLAAWILEDHLPVVLQPQLHKFIWDPQTRGV